MIENEKLPELLDGPFGCSVGSDIEVQYPARADLHSHEYANDLESGSNGNEEVAGNDGLGVIPNESRPALVDASAARPVRFEIFANRSRRNSDAKFKQKFVGNPFLAPGRILAAHLPDQFSQGFWQRRTPAPARFPAPKYPKRCSMPFDEGFRLDDHERASPVKELAETNHDKPENSGRSLRSDLAFLEQRELLSEKKILRDEGDAGAKEQAKEGQQLRILQELACQIEFLRSTTS